MGQEEVGWAEWRWDLLLIYQSPPIWCSPIEAPGQLVESGFEEGQEGGSWPQSWGQRAGAMEEMAEIITCLRKDCIFMYFSSNISNTLHQLQVIDQFMRYTFMRILFSNTFITYSLGSSLRGSCLTPPFGWTDQSWIGLSNAFYHSTWIAGLKVPLRWSYSGLFWSTLDCFCCWWDFLKLYPKLYSFGLNPF